MCNRLNSHIPHTCTQMTHSRGPLFSQRDYKSLFMQLQHVMGWLTCVLDSLQRHFTVFTDSSSMKSIQDPLLFCLSGVILGFYTHMKNRNVPINNHHTHTPFWYCWHTASWLSFPQCSRSRRRTWCPGWRSARNTSSPRSLGGPVPTHRTLQSHCTQM